MYNAIESIWSILKRYYNAHIGSLHQYSEKSVIALLNAAIKYIEEKNLWAKFVAKVERLILEDIKRECLDRGPKERILIEINVGDSDDDPECEECVDQDADEDDPQPINQDDVYGPVASPETINEDEPNQPAVPCRRALFPSRMKMKVSVMLKN